MYHYLLSEHFQYLEIVYKKYACNILVYFYFLFNDEPFKIEVTKFKAVIYNFDNFGVFNRNFKISNDKD